MPKKQKLELTWIGKDKRPKLEPRILIEDSDKSYHAKERVSENDLFDNMLIHGDNLLALKALEQEYAGKVKCIYIDPPYNTGSAFEHYDDGVEHSLWLSLIRDRLVLLRRLLSEDGMIFVQIDSHEMAYLKVLLDEVFGRQNHINDIIWKRRGGAANPSNRLNNVVDYILWYSKSSNYELKPIFTLEDEATQKYIADRFTGNLNGRKYMLAPIERNKKLGMRETMRYEYNGYIPEWGWMMSEENLKKMDESDRLHWNTKGRPNRRVFLEDYPGQPIGNLWTDIKVVNPMAIERSDFDGGQKPEKLIERVITLSTRPGDLVLDSFLGSGTTAAVAHKMGRRWIGIELGKHCETHCRLRLEKVVDSEDKGGITDAVDWKGGGGFRYYELGPSLIEEDKWGNPIISKEFDPPKLAQAMCKLEGFDYAPDQDTYWMQGRSSETDFIFVTSQTMTKAALAKLSDEVGPERSLLVCCPSFRAKETDFPNLTLKKIPKAVLKKCEWGRDDYSLQIQELPMAPPEEDAVEAKPKKPRRKFGKDNPNQKELF